MTARMRLFRNYYNHHATRKAMVVGVRSGSSCSATRKSRSILPYCRFFSTGDTVDDTSLRQTRASKLGLGSHKWSQLSSGGGKNIYKDLVETALANGWSTIEVGQDGGDAALAHILSQIEPSTSSKVSLLKRVGYRTVVPPPPPETKRKEDAEETAAPPRPPSMTKLLPGDVQVEDIAIPQTTLQQQPGAAAGTASVVHNLSQPALQAALQESPLYNQSSESSAVPYDLVVMLHNPEVQSQTDATLLTTAQRQARICDKLTEAFVALETEMAESAAMAAANGRVASYGIVSNGLGLPEDHPLHLSWSDAIAPALQQAQGQLDGDLHFGTCQLPLNLLETQGLAVARQIKHDRPTVQIHAMRPLTAYPDGGTGAGHPFVFCDFALPATLEKTLTWSNEMTSPPEVYHVALQTALQHFDAHDILESNKSTAELSADERETLDGCKLLQSLLHDVDVGLETVRSWEQHEHQLYTQIIPLIHDTFEGYDDDTAAVLQRFFAAYSLAVRYSIARNTRHLLVHGETTSSSATVAPPTYSDLPPTMRLQEYALRFLLQSKVVDKIIVGCTEPDHILQDLEIVHQSMQ